jgi:hypothetical protein
MRYGINIPNLGDPGAIVDLAVDAERAGWDGVFVWDHVAHDHNGPRPTTNPWVVLGAVAAVTDRVRVGPLVTPLARRRPQQVATEVITLDRLSNGRAVLGIGLGAPDEEFSAFGEDPDPVARAGRLDEAVDIVAAAMVGGPVRHTGPNYDVDATFTPGAVQRPRVPIWVAGFWPHWRPFARALRWDGVVPLMAGDRFPLPTPDETAVFADHFTARLDGPEPFDLVVSGHPDHPPSAYEAAGATWWLDGCDSTVDELEDLGRRVRLGPPH